MGEQEAETRSVQLSELQAGVALKSGHKTILVVDGITGTRRSAGGSQPVKDQPAGGDSSEAGGGPTGDKPTGDPAAAGASTSQAGQATTGAPKADPEPAQTEPAQAEPAQTEPAQTEPAQTEPAQTEPAQPGDAAGPAQAQPAEEKKDEEDLSAHHGEHIDADPEPAPRPEEHFDAPKTAAAGDRIVNWPHQPVPQELIEGYKKGLLSTGGNLGKCLQLACDTAINAGAPGKRNPQAEYKATLDLSWKGRKIRDLIKAVSDGKLLPGMIIHVKAHPDEPQTSAKGDSNHWFIYVGIGPIDGKDQPLFFDLDHHNLPVDPPRIKPRMTKDGKKPFGVRPPTARAMESYLASMPQGQSIVRGFYDPFSKKVKK